jgi:hypothetical protein
MKTNLVKVDNLGFSRLWDLFRLLLGYQ